MVTGKKRTNGEVIDLNEYYIKKEIKKDMGSFEEEQVSVIKPLKFSEVMVITEKLKRGETVVVNLNITDKSIQQSIIDFVCGVCYMLNGSIKTVSSEVYILSVDINMNSKQSGKNVSQ